MSLLDLRNTAQIFNSAVMGIPARRGCNQGASFVEITAFDLLLNFKNGPFVS